MNIGTEIFSMREKTALVTGATGYLGTAMSTILAESGAHVIVNSRSPEKANKLVDHLVSKGYSAEPAIFDITSKVDIENYFRSRDGLPLHVLINNAYSGKGGTVQSSTGDDYLTSFNIAVTSAHNLIQIALTALRKAVLLSGDASIINISSMYALVSPVQTIYDDSKSTNPPFYGSAKAALLQLTRYAACELGNEGIRVNAISPGPFPSQKVQQDNPEFIARLKEKVPMNRIGSSHEISGPVLFLASSASSFVNGANIIVDGGWTCW
ncbi:MAG: SDR family NAD(P)-dependent oxidoreductase [Oligoflexus sp.]